MVTTTNGNSFMTYDINVINILHWNCSGLNLNTDHSKLEDSDFYNAVIQHDLVLLCETHCATSSSIHVKGYGSFQLNRNVTKGNNRSYGGIAILYRNCMKNGLKFLEHKNGDYVWVKLLKEWFGLEKDYYLCYAYIPPENSSFYKSRGQDTLSFIESDIVKYSKLGPIILCGDLNARTKNLPDYIMNDEKIDHISEENYLYEEDYNIGMRSSQDEKVCSRGHKLLNLCIAAKLRILNGRLIGDASGRYTHHKSNGSSVNDYAIASEEIFSKVLYFHVNQFIGHLSDHCSISFAVKCPGHEWDKNEKSLHNIHKFPDQFIWDKNSILKYQHVFTNIDIQNEVSNLMESDIIENRQNINKTVQYINDIYIKAASRALNTRNMRRRRKNYKDSKKWFDKTLLQMKIELCKNSQLLQR